MPVEDSWMRCERQYFSNVNFSKLEVAEKKLNKILEEYNKFLQAALLEESPYVAEDLKLTILKHRGEGNAAESKGTESRSTDSKG